nr:hypothetical protein [Sphingobium sp. AP50]
MADPSSLIGWRTLDIALDGEEFGDPHDRLRRDRRRALFQYVGKFPARVTPASYFDDAPGRLGFGVAVKRVIARKTVRLEIPLIASEMFCRMRSATICAEAEGHGRRAHVTA